MRRQAILWCAAVTSLVGLATFAPADVVRYHYTPAACSAYSSLKVAPDGAVGELSPTVLGLGKQSYYCQLKPTHMVTYRHPATGQHVTVPIAFPDGTPRMMTQSDAIVYNYGLYTIRVIFLNDGSVDVVYNSGLFRPLQ